MQWLLIGAGGAVGAMCRFGLFKLLHHPENNVWPLATFTANTLGSIAMGVVYVLILERASLHPDLRYAVMVGLLGALTTFSTFSLEAIVLLEAGRIATAIGYVLLTLLVCLLGCYAGIAVTRSI